MKRQARLALQIKNLQVRRSKNFYLHVPDFTLKDRRIACLVGANGSGKTTLLEAAVGLVVPDHGTVSVYGEQIALDSIAAKKHIGYIPDDDHWIIAELTAREFFTLLAEIYRKAGVKKNLESVVSRLARRLQFSDFDKQLGNLSHGNKRKIQIIAALMHTPGLLLVDELRNGLDPVATKQAERLLREYQYQGGSLLVATHDLAWAEHFADDIVMVRDGLIVLQDSTVNLVKSAVSVEAAYLDVYGALA